MTPSRVINVDGHNNINNNNDNNVYFILDHSPDGKQIAHVQTPETHDNASNSNAFFHALESSG